mmetsp:Transcript_32535/g.44595  ORF Transcript_32535/g.44595 Transcript_32535/m.44595 type:complete len:90 (-) Transcript_32535:517-786(-)
MNLRSAMQNLSSKSMILKLPGLYRLINVLMTVSSMPVKTQISFLVLNAMKSDLDLVAEHFAKEEAHRHVNTCIKMELLSSKCFIDRYLF